MSRFLEVKVTEKFNKNPSYVNISSTKFLSCKSDQIEETTVANLRPSLALLLYHSKGTEALTSRAGAGE